MSHMEKEAGGKKRTEGEEKEKMCDCGR